MVGKMIFKMGTVKWGNIEHLSNFKAILKLCPIFFASSFKLRGQTKNSTWGLKTIWQGFAIIVGIILKKGWCSKLPPLRLISNTTIFCLL